MDDVPSESLLLAWYLFVLVLPITMPPFLARCLNPTDNSARSTMRSANPWYECIRLKRFWSLVYSANCLSLILDARCNNFCCSLRARGLSSFKLRPKL